MAQEIFRVYGTVAIREEGDIEQRMNDIGTSADNTGGKLGDLIKDFDLTGLAAGGLAGTLSGLLLTALKDSISFADDYSGALGDLAFDTDATKKEVEMFDDSLENLYRKGYGESIDDVADAISNVHRQTGLTNEELEKQVENTMLLSKKLDSDYGETIRTVDNLVKIFGGTHEEMFDLVAKGYQENLNVGGDLLDLFNEYSTKLQQLGFDENDMLNILIEGQEQGIFNYDLLLDGIKEYQIRISEMAEDQESSKEFFEDLGLNIKDVNEAYRKGGDDAKEMSQKVWEALSEIEDPLERNKKGTELFGTMWEDTGGKIVDVLTDIDEKTIETKGTMDKLVDTKTDSLSEEWEKFTRGFELDTYLPIGNMLKDLANQFLKYFNKADKYVEDGFNDMASTFEDWRDDFNKKLSDWKKDGIKIFEAWKIDSVDRFDETVEDLKGIMDWFETQADEIGDALNTITNGIASGWDSVTSAIGRTIDKIANIKFPSMPDWLPGFADGVKNLQDNTLAIVGERGPELVYLPKGSSVYSNQESKNMLNNANGLTEVSTGEGKQSIYIDKVVIDPQNIQSMTDFINMISNFKNEYATY